MIRCTSWKFLSVAALSSGLVLAAGCGDDDGDGMNPVADSGTEPDATDEPDASEEVTHSGLIAITEATVTNAEAVALGVDGATVTVGWSDDSTATVDPVAGFENNIGACRIFVYDADDELADPTDEGVVTVTGTANGEFACTFSEGEYRCQSTDEAASGAIAAGSTINPNAGGPGTALYTFEGADFTGANYVGMWIVVAGFTEATNNGEFPILAQQGANGLILGNPEATAEDPLEEAGTYATVVGAAPIPGGFDFLPAEAELTISKAASEYVPEIDLTIEPNGEGFELAEDSALPHEVPTDCSAVTFSCPGGAEDGDCGTVGGTPLRGMIISGETTDADIEGLAFNAMPDATGQYATFQCSAIARTGFTIPTEAMKVILGTNPTRMQFNVTYAAAAQVPGTNIVTGHTLTGFTDVVDTTGCDE